MSRRIPQQFIDELLMRTDIVDLIDAHVPLKKTGQNYQALCPFHNEKTPSFTVNREKQLFHCFGCEANGSAIGFLMNYMHLEFLDAVEELANRVGLEVPRGRYTDPVTSPSLALYALMEQVIRTYQKNLQQHQGGQRARAYLAGRGISKEMIAEYELGYATPAWDALAKAKDIADSDAKLTQLLEIGVVIKSDRGGYYDRFRDRVVFPIRDQRGRFIGLGGRVLDDRVPKYLNSPETQLFHKGREVYGLYQAKKAVRELPLLYVVEGYMDVLALAQSGIRNAVATLGTAVTVEQLEKLFRSTSQLVFCFDGDAAGKKAAHRAMQIVLSLLHEGRQVFFRFIPADHDPDSYVRKYGKARFEMQQEQIPLSDYLLSFLQQDLSLATLEDKAKFADRANRYLQNMPKSAFKQLLIKKTAQLTGLELDAPRPKTRRLQGRSGQVQPLVAVTKPMTVAIASLLRKPALALEDKIGQALQQIEIDGHTLLSEIVQFILQNPKTNAAAIIEHWHDTKYGARLAALAPVDSPYGDECEDLYTDQNIRLTLCAAIENMQGINRRRGLKKLTGIKCVGELTEEHLAVLSALADRDN